jgi:hypothetical protein
MPDPALLPSVISRHPEFNPLEPGVIPGSFFLKIYMKYG